LTTVFWGGLRGAQAGPYTAGARTISFAEPCGYFREGKAKASTLSLSVLVAIEMFNALNALSEARCFPMRPPLCFVLGDLPCTCCVSSCAAKSMP
jgi:hypothetical protein